jgi:hypothetical protein
MVSLPPEQFFSERFIDDLASPPRWNKPKQFFSDLLINRHIEFGHDIPPSVSRHVYAP